MVGLDDLQGLFYTKQLFDSEILCVIPSLSVLSAVLQVAAVARM